MSKTNFYYILIFCLFFQLNFSQNEKVSFELNLIQQKHTPYFNSFIEDLNINSIKYKSDYSFLEYLDFYSLSYLSQDSLKIDGFLIRPKKEGIYPVLIYNRGGNSYYGETRLNFLVNFLAKIAQHGYVIVTSNLRGTNDNNGNDEFGGKDIDDALDVITIIDSLSYVDKDRIALLGWSRGVMTNFLMMKRTGRIKTNIAIAGQADLSLTHRDEMFEVYKKRIPNFEKEKDSLLRSRSSLLAIDSLKNNSTSHFIIHGNIDSKVKVENAFFLYDKLLLKKQKTRLLIYENEEHGLKNVWDSLIFNIAEWLKAHL